LPTNACVAEPELRAGNLCVGAEVVLRARLSNSSPLVRKLLDQLDDRQAKDRPQCSEQPFGRQREPAAPPPRILQTQRRLSAEQVDQLVAAYQAGKTVRELASQFDLHRTTVLAHLERQGVSRRASRRKLTVTR
jgi:hypothetical protein